MFSKKKMNRKKSLIFFDFFFNSQHSFQFPEKVEEKQKIGAELEKYNTENGKLQT